MLVDTICNECGKPFKRKKRLYNEAVKHGWRQFCGSECRKKAKTLKKIPCPVCDTPFSPRAQHGKRQMTCSAGCANTYFRSGRNNPNFKKGSLNAHRHICFEFHKKECIICGEDKIVEVHHYDNDHYNNSPENLIPLCPTHHRYYHSKYRKLVEDKIKNFHKKQRDRLQETNNEHFRHDGQQD